MTNKFHCDNCGTVTLSHDEMMHQLSNPDIGWRCPNCRHEMWPNETPKLKWELMQHVPYNGDDTSFEGASFDRYKFYSPRMVARIRELGEGAAKAVNTWLHDWSVWPEGGMDGMQFSHVDGDYVVCRAISL